MKSAPPAKPAHDPWQALRRCTAARIGLGRVGASMPTDALLRFGLAHAQARDAVHGALDAAALAQDLAAQGFSTLEAHSMALDRESYLLRPDQHLTARFRRFDAAKVQGAIRRALGC